MPFYLISKGGCVFSPITGPSAVAHESGAPNLSFLLELEKLSASSGTPSKLPGYVIQKVSQLAGEGNKGCAMFNQGNFRIHLSQVYKAFAFA